LFFWGADDALFASRVTFGESLNWGEPERLFAAVGMEEQVTVKIGEGGMGEVYRARDTKLDPRRGRD
jgi:hypothetical protein